MFFLIQNFWPVKEEYNKEKCAVVKSPIELSLMSKLGKVCFWKVNDHVSQLSHVPHEKSKRCIKKSLKKSLKKSKKK